jgi:hypothetical protein
LNSISLAVVFAVFLLAFEPLTVGAAIAGLYLLVDAAVGLITGKSITHRVTSWTARQLGASEETAEAIGTGADIGVTILSLLSGLGLLGGAAKGAQAATKGAQLARGAGAAARGAEAAGEAARGARALGGAGRAAEGARAVEGAAGTARQAGILSRLAEAISITHTGGASAVGRALPEVSQLPRLTREASRLISSATLESAGISRLVRGVREVGGTVYSGRGLTEALRAAGVEVKVAERATETLSWLNRIQVYGPIVPRTAQATSLVQRQRVATALSEHARAVSRAAQALARPAQAAQSGRIPIQAWVVQGGKRIPIQAWLITRGTRTAQQMHHVLPRYRAAARAGAAARQVTRALPGTAARQATRALPAARTATQTATRTFSWLETLLLAGAITKTIQVAKTATQVQPRTGLDIPTRTSTDTHEPGRRRRRRRAIEYEADFESLPARLHPVQDIEFEFPEIEPRPREETEPIMPTFRKSMITEPSPIIRRALGLPGTLIGHPTGFTTDVLGMLADIFAPRMYSGQGVGLHIPKAYTYMPTALTFDDIKHGRYVGGAGVLKTRSRMARRGA